VITHTGIYYLSFLGVFDQNQNLLMIDDVVAGKGRNDVNVSLLPQGIYMITLEFNDHIYSKRIVRG